MPSPTHPHQPAPAAEPASDQNAGDAVRRPGLALVCAAVVGIIWAGWIVVSARGLGAGLTAYDLTLFRFAVPAAITFPWLLRRSLWRAWPQVLFVGLFIGAPHALFVQWGLEGTNTAHGAVMLPGFVPLFTVLLAWLWFGDRPSAFAFAGFGLIFAGVVLIAFPDAAAGGAGLIWPGDAYFIVGALIWAVYTLALKAWPLPPMESVAILSVLSTLVYLPIYLLGLPSGLVDAELADILLQAIYQGLIGILVAVALYAVVVRLAGPQRAATIAAAVPILTLLLGIGLLDEVPSWLQVLGGLTAGAGIWLVVARGTRRARRTA